MCFDGSNKNISLKDSTFPKQVANLITVRDSGDILADLMQIKLPTIGNIATNKWGQRGAIF